MVSGKWELHRKNTRYPVKWWTFIASELFADNSPELIADTKTCQYQNLMQTIKFVPWRNI